MRLAPLLLLVLATFALAAPIRADDACDADERTRMCLLDRAMAVATRQRPEGHSVRMLRDIAQIAETSGTVPMDDFIPLFLARLEEAVPYGTSRLIALTRTNGTCSPRTGPIVARTIVAQLRALEQNVTAEDRRIFGEKSTETQRANAMVECLFAANARQEIPALLARHPSAVPTVVQELLRREELHEARALIATYQDDT